MSKQSSRAANGKTSMAVRLNLPLSSGRSQAPKMSIRPECSHSIVIVILAAHQPQLSDEFRHNDDRHAGDKSVQRAPAGKILEWKVRFTSREDPWQNNLRQRNQHEAGIKPALDPGQPCGIFDLPLEKIHGMILPASCNTIPG